MVDHRLAEVRVNIPSFDPELYRRRAGGRGSLWRALGHAAAFAELGVRVDATCVLDEREVDGFLDRVEQEKRLLGTLEHPFSALRFVRNAFYARTLVPWSDCLLAAGYDPAGPRHWVRRGKPAVIVSHCDGWDEPQPDADWYLVPPGVRLTDYVAGPARSI
jgi:hypothetical protein